MYKIAACPKVDHHKNLLLKGAIIAKYDTLYSFAQDLSVHPSLVSHVISGRWELNSEEKRKWARTLGSSVAKLFPQKDT
jgi:hypothetical protein